MQATGWTLRWATTWPEAFALGDTVAWEALAAGPCGHPFAHPALVRAWADTVGAATGVQPWVCVAHDADGTTAVLPAVVRRYAGRWAERAVLEPAGGSLFGYHAPVWSRAPSVDQATRFWDGVRAVTGGTVHQALFRLVAPTSAGARHQEPAGDDSPVLSLAGLTDFDAVLARLSRNAREQVRRAARRLGDAGPVRLHLAAPTDAADAARRFHREVVPAYRARWRERRTACLLDEPGVADCFARVVEDGVAGGWGQFATLLVGEEPVAWHVGLVHATGWHWWLPTHAAAWDALAPGRVLLAELIAAALAHRVPALHLLTGGHRYKRSWQPEPGPLCTVRWYAPGLRGTAARVYDRWRGARPTTADDPPEEAT